MPDEVNSLPHIPERSRESHKGDCGRVLIVAGSPGLTGAGCLAAWGAQRAGAGLVTVAVPQALNPIFEVKLTSCMSRSMPEPDSVVLAEAGAECILDWATQADVVALGPGLGRAEPTVAAVRRLVRELPVPAVVDADGLNALGGRLEALDEAAAVRILTPHPGEMARLLGADTAAEVQKRRQQAATTFAKRHRALVALKGAGTIVTDGERMYVNCTGNPGMATGGTGDVLTGLVAGLLCQNLQAFQAVQLAVFLHGLAGDFAARERGELSMTAEDLLDATPRAFCAYRAVQDAGSAAEVAQNALQLY